MTNNEQNKGDTLKDVLAPLIDNLRQCHASHDDMVRIITQVLMEEGLAPKPRTKSLKGAIAAMLCGLQAGPAPLDYWVDTIADGLRKQGFASPRTRPPKPAPMDGSGGSLPKTHTITPMPPVKEPRTEYHHHQQARRDGYIQAALQGFCANSAIIVNDEKMAISAVECGDAAMKEADK